MRFGVEGFGMTRPVSLELARTPDALRGVYPSPPSPAGFRVESSGPIWLPGKGNSNSHGARPDHQIILMIKWIRTSGLSIKNSFYFYCSDIGGPNAWGRQFLDSQHLLVSCRYNYCTEMCSGSEEGSYLRLIDLCISQL